MREGKQITLLILLERFSEIERENKILLEKMTSILVSGRSNPNLKQPNSAKLLPLHSQSSDENITLPQIDTQESKIASATTLPPIKKSLNSIVRRKQLKKISEENQFLFKKLANGKSNYDAEKWATEDSIRIRTLKNICEFPY